MSAEDLKTYVDKVSKLFAGEDITALPAKITEAVEDLLRQSDMVVDTPVINADDEAVNLAVPSSLESDTAVGTATTIEPTAETSVQDPTVVEKPWRKAIPSGMEEASELSSESNAVEWILESSDKRGGSVLGTRAVELTDQERRILKSRIQQLKYNYDMLINH